MAESSQKRVENTVGKGEIARYEHFSFFHSVLKELYYRQVKKGLVWERAKALPG